MYEVAGATIDQDDFTGVLRVRKTESGWQATERKPNVALRFELLLTDELTSALAKLDRQPPASSAGSSESFMA